VFTWRCISASLLRFFLECIEKWRQYGKREERLNAKMEKEKPCVTDKDPRSKSLNSGRSQRHS
jgi:hypothetical protein